MSCPPSLSRVFVGRSFFLAGGQGQGQESMIIPGVEYSRSWPRPSPTQLYSRRRTDAARQRAYMCLNKDTPRAKPSRPRPTSSSNADNDQIPRTNLILKNALHPAFTNAVLLPQPAPAVHDNDGLDERRADRHQAPHDAELLAAVREGGQVVLDVGVGQRRVDGRENSAVVTVAREFG